MLVLVSVVVANGAALALVLGRGTAFMLGPLGGLLQVPIVLGLGVAVHQILARLLGEHIDRTGLVPSRRDLPDLALGLLSGVGGVAAISLLVSATSEARVVASPSPAVLLALLSFTVNAALQQLALVGLVLALGASDGPSRLGLAFSLLFFVATHASESVAPIYLVNVALFGLATLGLFVARRGLGWATGLHGAWNTVLVCAGGVPLEGAGGVQLLAWSTPDTTPDGTWSGGSAGFEHGLANTVVCLLVAGGAWWWARRARQGV